MASGRCEGERDHPITLSFVYLYALLPPVTGVLGLLPKMLYRITIILEYRKAPLEGRRMARFQPREGPAQAR